MNKIANKINYLFGLFITVLSSIFGRFWYLFAAFLLLNCADYLTGVLKAKLYRKENSNKGLWGIIKKVSYWLIIALSFFLAVFFGHLGGFLGIDLKITRFLGYFTLSTFIINEARSVLENLCAMGVYVPEFLLKGLEVAETAIKKKR